MVPAAAADDVLMRTLLAHLGTAMTAAGQPVSEVEDDLDVLARTLGFPRIQVAATPTGITVALASGQPATFESVDHPLRLDQAADVRFIRQGLLADQLSVADALDQLETLRERPPRLAPGWAGLGLVTASVGIALIIQPGWPNLAFAVLGSVVVAGLVRLAGRSALVTTLLPVLASFVLSCGVFALAEAGWLDGPVRTLLPPLAVLLPGALLVTAMSELAAGDMVAGTARLTFGLVQLLLFTFGVVAASRLLAVSPRLLGNVRVDQLGWWAAPLGVLLVSAGLGLMESPPPALLPWIAAVLALTFGAQTLGQQLLGVPWGSFTGALAASLGSYLVEAVRPNLPRLVVFLPAFWLLVPGSLGLLSTTQLAVEAADATATAIQVLAVIFAIALGLLFGAAVIQSLRGVNRQLRRFRRRRPV